MNHLRCARAACGVLMACLAVPLAAQEAKEPFRTRVALGPQLVPSYPGSDNYSLRPLVDVSRARGDRPFEFEAPDESFGFPVIRSGGFALGPAIGFEGERTGDDVGTDLPKVGLTVEPGAFVQYAFSDNFRVRLEGRKGIGGHKGLIGTVGADYIARDGDQWLFSIGPRLTFADDRYQRAYFSVRAKDAVAAGLPVYSADAGLQSAGVVAGYIQQLTARWGIYSYARYERLVGDAADSPITRRYGSPDQLSGGIALTYTFGQRR